MTQPAPPQPSASSADAGGAIAQRDSAAPASQLDKFVERARRLYTLPSVAMRVLELTNSPGADARQLKECIEIDPALAAKILRVVNSSVYGLSRQVQDLTQALALIGAGPLKLLVLGFSLPTNLLQEIEAETLSRYWRRSLTNGVAARQFAEQCFDVDGDEAFIAGLLSGVGMLALIQDLGAPYCKFLKQVETDGGDLTSLETATMGFDHLILGARMLDHWGLPRSLVEAVAAPRNVDAVCRLPEQQRTLPQILHLAELLTAVVTSANPARLETLLQAADSYAELSYDEVEPLVAQLQESVEQLADAFRVSLPDGKSYLDALLQAQSHMADATESELSGRQTPPTSPSEPPSPSNVARLNAAVEAMSGLDSAATLAPRQSSEDEIEPPKRSPSPVAAAQVDLDLDSQLSAAIAACRRKRQAISLAVLEIDEFDELVLTQGLVGANQMMQLLCAAAGVLCPPPHRWLQDSDSSLALLLHGADRSEAISIARKLGAGVRQWSHRRSTGVVTLSGGVATLTQPPKNFPAATMIEAARRCLYAAQASAGDSVKSIDMI